MSDSIPLVRAPNGGLTGRQRKKIVATLGWAKLSSLYKHTILRWVNHPATVVNGSTVDTALKAAHAIKAIY